MGTHGGPRQWLGFAVCRDAGGGYRTGAAQDDNQSSLLSALWGVRGGWGQRRSPSLHPSPQGLPGTAGAHSLPPPRLALFPQGCVPTRPIFVWAPSLPGGLLIPPKRARGLLTELPYPLNKQAQARSCCRIKRHPFAAVAPAPEPASPRALSAPHVRCSGDASGWGAAGMATRGAPTVKPDRFSAAFPAPEMPDLPGLVRVAAAWGGEAGACPCAGLSPGRARLLGGTGTGSSGSPLRPLPAATGHGVGRAVHGDDRGRGAALTLWNCGSSELD